MSRFPNPTIIDLRYRLGLFGFLAVEVVAAFASLVAQTSVELPLPPGSGELSCCLFSAFFQKEVNIAQPKVHSVPDQRQFCRIATPLDSAIIFFLDQTGLQGQLEQIQIGVSHFVHLDRRQRAGYCIRMFYHVCILARKSRGVKGNKKSHRWGAFR